jgi:cell division protein ZapE
MFSVQQAYESALQARGYNADPAQLRAVQALDACARGWSTFKERRSNAIKKLFNHPDIPRGLYLYGGVGRGKSFLMDLFYDSVPLKRKTRLHFHEFMREVHRELAQLKGVVNPLDVLASHMAEKYKLICFDEFHVSDITDAMILHRLLKGLFDRSVGLVATSNYRPDDLYAHGLQRERFLPAIALLKQQLDVLNVDNGVDYRNQTLSQLELFHSPLDEQAQAAMTDAFERLSETHDEDPVMTIEARQIQALRRAGGVVWFDFKTLCGGPRSQNDYLEIASQFHTVLLSGVPEMTPRMASEARRFTWLVDVLYDRRVKLIMSAQVPAEDLYNEGQMAHEFVRTVSRLHEMRSAEFLSLARRDVDTRLT